MGLSSGNTQAIARGFSFSNEPQSLVKAGALSSPSPHGGEGRGEGVRAYRWGGAPRPNLPPHGEKEPAVRVARPVIMATSENNGTGARHDHAAARALRLFGDCRSAPAEAARRGAARVLDHRQLRGLGHRQADGTAG